MWKCARIALPAECYVIARLETSTHKLENDLFPEMRRTLGPSRLHSKSSDTMLG